MTARPPGGGDLHALLAAICHSPIIARLSARFVDAREWARIRRSAEVDAFILAWIASHVRDRPRRPRLYM